MGPDQTLSEELDTVQHRWEQMTAVPESPRTLMSVIEYSLGTQRKAEVYVNRFLKYLLDPEEPHGMDSDLLRTFLNGLPAECGFQEDTYDLSDIVVDEQARVTQEEEDGTVVSSGIVDLLIEVPNEWFLMVELKFGAEDTQTQFYYRDVTHLGGDPQETYESGAYYVYLRPRDRPTANEPEFSNWTWEELCRDVLNPFILDNGSRLSQRTVAQLHEFTDDIANITGMTEHQENEREKIALFLDHYDAISDVTDTFDEAWDRFTGEWGARLGNALAEDGHGSVPNHDDEQVTRFILTRTGGDAEPWNFRSNSSDWGMIFKDGWWRHLDDLGGTIQSRPDDRNDVRIGFHHRLGRNRDLAIGERTLKVYFRNMGANDQRFIDTFSRTFDANEPQIAEALPGRATITGNKKDKIVVPYDIDAEDRDFFTAYIDALETAYVDLIGDNNDLVTEIDSIFCESLEAEYDYSDN
ncbi:PD-(D/E)XK nuclease family protein [Halobaculum roseum]|uniref:PD-(D/E)XK nuclease family protein n=1 Tax=Halobaculum roseum TaxID=2175149 RepID=A0ABD5MHR0_9EURY|nr:PD-(D/E)XK nuclease family protein [Halobaculum roseum]QZY01909.1 PD-(D/E)XK nuclease family protein [Halobaculum roseum]